MACGVIGLGIGDGLAVEGHLTDPMGLVMIEGRPTAGGQAAGLQPGMNLVGLRLHHNAICQGTIREVGADYADLHMMDGRDQVHTELPLRSGLTFIQESAVAIEDEKSKA